MSNVTHGGARTSNQGENRMEDMKEKGQAAARSLQDLGASVKESAQEGYEAVRERASDMMERGKSTAINLEESLESRIRDNPLAALGLALGAGFLLGMCMVRRG